MVHVTEKERIEELCEEIYALTEIGQNTYDRVAGRSKLTGAAEVLETLVQNGMVSRSGEGGQLVNLTPSGNQLARSVVRRHRLAEMLFSQVLALEEEVSEATACRLEHILSAAVTDSVCTFLGHPPLCPHGKPIPPGDCCELYTQDLRPLVLRLLDVAVGDTFSVVFIRSLAHDRLDRIGTLGLVPGARMRLSQKRPTVVVEIGETTVALDREVAREVYVRRLESYDEFPLES